MTTRSILVPRQVYQRNSVIYSDYFDITNRSQEWDFIDEKLSKALLFWADYDDNHGIVYFDR